MKRIVAVLTVMSVLFLIAGLGINYAKERVETHLETLNKAKEYASAGDYTSAQKEMEILDNQFIKTKKILSLYILDNVVDDAEREVKYTKSLAEEENEEFLSQAVVCEYYICQLYDAEKLGLKMWF